MKGIPLFWGLKQTSGSHSHTSGSTRHAHDALGCWGTRGITGPGEALRPAIRGAAAGCWLLVSWGVAPSSAAARIIGSKLCVDQIPTAAGDFDIRAPLVLNALYVCHTVITSLRRVLIGLTLKGGVGVRRATVTSTGPLVGDGPQMQVRPNCSYGGSGAKCFPPQFTLPQHPSSPLDGIDFHCDAALRDPTGS